MKYVTLRQHHRIQISDWLRTLDKSVVENTSGAELSELWDQAGRTPSPVSPCSMVSIRGATFPEIRAARANGRSNLQVLSRVASLEKRMASLETRMANDKQSGLFHPLANPHADMDGR